MRSLLVIVTLVALFVAPGARAHGGPLLTAADVDASGSTSLMDVQLIIAMALLQVPPQPDADANDDGIVDDLDVNRALSVALERLPVVFALQPARVAPGATVTIHGQGFGSGEDEFTVLLDTGAAEAEVEPTWVDARTMTVAVPLDAWSGPVEVRRVATDEESNAPFLNVVSGNVSFPRNVQPVLGLTCAFGGCHAGAFPQENLSLATGAESYAGLVNVAANQRPTFLRVAPGNSMDSYLMEKLLLSVPTLGARMPLDEPVLDPVTIQVVRDWIDQGAAGQ